MDKKHITLTGAFFSDGMRGSSSMAFSGNDPFVSPEQSEAQLCTKPSSAPGTSLDHPDSPGPFQTPRAGIKLGRTGVHCITSPAHFFKCQYHYSILHAMPRAATSRADVKIVIKTYKLWKTLKKKSKSWHCPKLNYSQELPGVPG